MKNLYKKSLLSLWLLVSIILVPQIKCMKKGEYILACWTNGGYVLILDPAQEGEKALQKTIIVKKRPFLSLLFSKNGKHLATETSGNLLPSFTSVNIWNSSNWKLIGSGPQYGGNKKWKNLKEKTGYPKDFLDYSRFFIKKEGDNIIIYKTFLNMHLNFKTIKNAKLDLKNINLDDDKIFSPNFQYMVIYNKNGMHIYDIKTGKCFTKKEQTLHWIQRLSFTSNRKYLAVSKQENILIYDFENIIKTGKFSIYKKIPIAPLVKNLPLFKGVVPQFISAISFKPNLPMMITKEEKEIRKKLEQIRKKKELSDIQIIPGNS